MPCDKEADRGSRILVGKSPLKRPKEGRLNGATGAGASFVGAEAEARILYESRFTTLKRGASTVNSRSFDRALARPANNAGRKIRGERFAQDDKSRKR